MAYIEVQNLSKSYKKKTKVQNKLFKKIFLNSEALKEVSFSIEKGEKVAYLGVNGSGKSTTIKILSGILYPTNGKVLVDGIIPYENRIMHSKKIGVVFGQRAPLYWDLPLIDSLEVLCKIYDVTDADYKSMLGKLDLMMNLKEILYSPVRQLSLGQKMIANIICAVIHSPDILILDEPTIGLDIFAKEKVRNLINQLNANFNTTVFLSSHDLADVEKICSKVFIIHEGQIIYQGSMNDLKEQYCTYYYLKIYYSSSSSKFYNLQDILGHKFSNKSDYIEFKLHDYSTVSEILNELEIKGHKYSKIEVKEVDFESIIKQILLSEFDRNIPV